MRKTRSLPAALTAALLLVASIVCLLPLAATAQGNDEQSVGDGLVAYWSFDELKDGKFADNSGNGHDGTLCGDAALVDGKLGGAVRFSTKGDMVTVPVTSDLNFNEDQSYTVSLWVKPEDVGGSWQSVFCKGRGAATHLGFWFTDAAKSKFRFGQSNTYSKNQDSSLAAVNGAWYNVVLVQDAQSGKSILYINGEVASSKDWTVDATTGSYLIIGAERTDGTSPFSGVVDEMKIYSRALTPEQISAAYAADLSAASTLVAHWSFDELSIGDAADGTTVADSAGTNNGTIKGSCSTVVAGAMGNALHLTAASDRVEIPIVKDSCLNFSDTDSYTISLWVKPDTLGGWRCVLNKGRGASTPYVGIWFNGEKVHVGHDSSQSNTNYNSNAKYMAGEWINIVVVQDTAAWSDGDDGTRACRVYINGELAALDKSADYCGSSSMPVGSSILLGALRSDGTEGFTGMIDEVKIYNVALDADRIKSDHARVDTSGSDSGDNTQQPQEPQCEYARFDGEWPMLGEDEKPGIILDTDIGGDCDDLGAVAMLYYFAGQGKVTPLATVSCVARYSAPLLRALGTYYGYADVPVGCRTAGTDYGAFSYSKYITAYFDTDIKDNTEAMDAVELYRKVLSEAEDGSVTIVTIGTLVNLSDLLKTKGDKYSPLDGTALVQQKVKQVIAMGGKFPSGKETNIKNAPAASQYVNLNWPTPIVYCGFEIADKMLTGKRLDEIGSSNPVSAGYQQYFNYHTGGKLGRPSWDPLTVYFACAGWSEYYDLCRGDIYFDDEGNNSFTANAESGARGYLVLKSGYTVDSIAEMLDGLIVAAKADDSRTPHTWEYVDDKNESIKKVSDAYNDITVPVNGVEKVVFDNTYYISESVGATIEYTFCGSGILAYGGYGKAYGIIDVYLDGALVKTVDLYSSREYSGCMLAIEGLSCTEHTLKLVTKAERNAASSGNQVLLDFFKVDKTESPIDLNIIPKSNILLDADFKYNVYIPKISEIVGIELGGEAIALYGLPTTVIDGVEHYVVTKAIAAKDAADSFDLKIIAASGSKTYTGTYKISIPAYAAKIMAGSYDAATKALMQDMLAYISSATTYFGTSSDSVRAELSATINKQPYTAPTADSVGFNSAASDINGLSSVLESACLNTGDTPAFVFYVKSGIDATKFSFTANGAALRTEIGQENGGQRRTYIVVTAYAYGMGETINITYTDGANSHSGSYDLAAYYNGTCTGNRNLASLVITLAKYSASAKAYRNAVNGI